MSKWIKLKVDGGEFIKIRLSGPSREDVLNLITQVGKDDPILAFHFLVKLWLEEIE